MLYCLGQGSTCTFLGRSYLVSLNFRVNSSLIIRKSSLLQHLLVTRIKILINDLLMVGYYKILDQLQSTHSIAGNYCAQHRQECRLKHCATSTIYTCMIDALHKTANEFLEIQNSYKLRGNKHAIVVLSQTKIGKSNIYIRNEKDTINNLLTSTKSRT